MTVSPRNPSVGTFARTRPVIVIGIGSPHGDDRAGWEVIDRLSIVKDQKFLPVSSKNVVLHKASVPHDVLDWFDVQSRTHIIDASCDQLCDVRCFAITLGMSGKLQLNKVDSKETTNPDLSSVSLRSSSTHQLDLISTLELSATLGTLPSELFLWTVSVASIAKNGEISQEAQVHIDRCVLALAKELCHA